jgi:hypothetical protein
MVLGFLATHLSAQTGRLYAHQTFYHNLYVLDI